MKTVSVISGQSFDGAASPRTWPTHFGRMPRDEPAEPATDTAEERLPFTCITGSDVGLCTAGLCVMT